MNKTFNISLRSILVCAVVFFLGYLVGRGFGDKVEVEKEVIRWRTEQLPPIHDTIVQAVPVVVVNTDTVEKIVTHTLEVDTMQILADYYKVKKYDLDFSNDSIGTFKVAVDITKNSLARATSDIRPIKYIEEHTKYVSKVKNLQFYTMFGSSVDFRTNKIQGGVDLRQKYMMGLSGIRVEDKYGYTIDLGIKF